MEGEAGEAGVGRRGKKSHTSEEKPKHGNGAEKREDGDQPVDEEAGSDGESERKRMRKSTRGTRQSYSQSELDRALLAKKFPALEGSEYQEFHSADPHMNAALRNYTRSYERVPSPLGLGISLAGEETRPPPRRSPPRSNQAPLAKSPPVEKPPPVDESVQRAGSKPRNTSPSPEEIRQKHWGIIDEEEFVQRGLHQQTPIPKHWERPEAPPDFSEQTESGDLKEERKQRERLWSQSMTKRRVESQFGVIRPAAYGRDMLEAPAPRSPETLQREQIKKIVGVPQINHSAYLYVKGAYETCQAQLKKKIDSLYEMSEDLEEANARIEEYEEQGSANAGLRKENEALTAQVDRLTAAQGSQDVDQNLTFLRKKYKITKAQLEHQVDLLKGDASERRAREARLKEEVAASKAASHKLQERNDVLANEISEATARNEYYEKKAESLELNNGRLGTFLRASENRCERVEAELHSCRRNHHDRLAREVEEIERAAAAEGAVRDREIQTLKDQVRMLQSELELGSTAADEMDGLKIESIYTRGEREGVERERGALKEEIRKIEPGAAVGSVVVARDTAGYRIQLEKEMRQAEVEITNLKRELGNPAGIVKELEELLQRSAAKEEDQLRELKRQMAKGQRFQAAYRADMEELKDREDLLEKAAKHLKQHLAEEADANASLKKIVAELTEVEAECIQDEQDKIDYAGRDRTQTATQKTSAQRTENPSLNRPSLSAETPSGRLDDERKAVAALQQQHEGSEGDEALGASVRKSKAKHASKPKSPSEGQAEAVRLGNQLRRYGEKEIAWKRERQELQYNNERLRIKLRTLETFISHGKNPATDQETQSAGKPGVEGRDCQRCKAHNGHETLARSALQNARDKLARDKRATAKMLRIFQSGVSAFQSKFNLPLPTPISLDSSDSDSTGAGAHGNQQPPRTSAENGKEAMAESQKTVKDGSCCEDKNGGDRTGASSLARPDGSCENCERLAQSLVATKRELQSANVLIGISVAWVAEARVELDEERSRSDTVRTEGTIATESETPEPVDGTPATGVDAPQSIFTVMRRAVEEAGQELRLEWRVLGEAQRMAILVALVTVPVLVVQNLEQAGIICGLLVTALTALIVYESLTTDVEDLLVTGRYPSPATKHTKLVSHDIRAEDQDLSTMDWDTPDNEQKYELRLARAGGHRPGFEQPIRRLAPIDTSSVSMTPEEAPHVVNQFEPLHSPFNSPIDGNDSEDLPDSAWTIPYDFLFDYPEALAHPPVAPAPAVHGPAPSGRTRLETVRPGNDQEAVAKAHAEELAAVEQQLATLQTHAGELEQQVSAAEATSARRMGRIAALEEDVDWYDDRLEKQKHDVAYISKKADAAEKDKENAHSHTAHFSSALEAAEAALDRVMAQARAVDLRRRQAEDARDRHSPQLAMHDGAWRQELARLMGQLLSRLPKWESGAGPRAGRRAWGQKMRRERDRRLSALAQAAADGRAAEWSDEDAAADTWVVSDDGDDGDEEDGGEDDGDEDEDEDEDEDGSSNDDDTDGSDGQADGRASVGRPPTRRDGYVD